MIYTRFENKVKVTGYTEQTGMIEYTRLEDNAERVAHISEFKADGGIQEIYAEIEKAGV